MGATATQSIVLGDNSTFQKGRNNNMLKLKRKEKREMRQKGFVIKAVFSNSEVKYFSSDREFDRHLETNPTLRVRWAHIEA